MKKYVIGVDIGGTKIAVGIIDGAGKLKKKVVVPTLAGDGFKTSLGQVYKAIDELLKTGGIKKREIGGIGVCAPGPLDPVKGIVHNPPNLPGWREVPLVSLISKKFKKNTKLENDANAAGLAEMIWGAAKKYKHVFYVTVSTGIGTAIIINGEIYHGKNGMAGEGGHATINYDDVGSVCNCGNIGCIETLASGPGTVRRLKSKLRQDPGRKSRIKDIVNGDIEKITMETVGEAARRGDELALDTIAEEGKFLGIWLASMISLLDPEVIVIGGGVSLLGDLIFKEIKKNIPPRTINKFAVKTPVVPAKLKKDVGIFGAASIMLRGK